MNLSRIYKDDQYKPTRKKYQQRYTFEERSTESLRIIERYPDRIPIIVEKSSTCGDDIPEIDKNKFLVPTDLTIGQFLYVIRRRIRLSPIKALYLLTLNGTAPSSSQFIKNIYDQHKDPDHFLYFEYSGENAFGNFSF